MDHTIEITKHAQIKIKGQLQEQIKTQVQEQIKLHTQQNNENNENNKKTYHNGTDINVDWSKLQWAYQNL